MGLKAISVSYSANGDDTTKALKKLKGKNWAKILDKFGKQGVLALQDATPVDTGKTASSWGYHLEMLEPGKLRLVFTNDNVKDEWANVAILIQYGHATRNGSWVEGRDYINPAIQPIFDRISAQAWEEIEDA